MQNLRSSIREAKKELKNKIKIPGEIQEQLPLEMMELNELEEQLKKYIKQGEEILKQNIKEI